VFDICAGLSSLSLSLFTRAYCTFWDRQLHVLTTPGLHLKPLNMALCPCVLPLPLLIPSSRRCPAPRSGKWRSEKPVFPCFR